MSYVGTSFFSLHMWNTTGTAASIVVSYCPETGLFRFGVLRGSVFVFIFLFNPLYSHYLRHLYLIVLAI